MPGKPGQMPGKGIGFMSFSRPTRGEPGAPITGLSAIGAPGHPSQQAVADACAELVRQFEQDMEDEYRLQLRRREARSR